MPVAPSIARVGRFLRSIFAPATAIFGFSCLLTFIFVLYQPHPGPGALQRLGWQSWDIVSSQSSTGVSSTHSRPPPDHGTDTAISDVDRPSGEYLPDGADWWNVTEPEAALFDPASLPLDVWDPLMPHDTGCM